MKKILNFVLLIACVFILISFKSGKVIRLQADFLTDVTYDYDFECVIDDIIYTSQFNGQGSKIPYTFFKAKLIKQNNGNDMEGEISIKFYGGYDNKNNLILYENMDMLELGESYHIIANKTSVYNDNRTLSNSFVISNPNQYVRLNNQNKTIPNSSIDHNIDETIFGGGGGGTANTSFDTAYHADLDAYYKINFTNAIDKRFYKFTSEKKQYISIYTIGEYDTYIRVYDENKNLIFENDNVNSNHGKTLTNKENAFINFLVDKNKLYYFSIEASVDNSYQPIEFYIKVDNWSNNDPSDLVLVLAGAGTIDLGDYEAQFNNHSKYVEEIEFSVNEWNSLGLIKIYEDNKSTLPNFAIYDNYDSDSTSLAVTLPLVLYNGIYLNDYYFTNMTKFERIKTIIHELGHILGLNEFTGLEEDINVMVQGKREFKQFGPADILVYNYLWGQR